MKNVATRLIFCLVLIGLFRVSSEAAYSRQGVTCSTGVTAGQNTTGATFIVVSVTADTGTLPSNLTDSKSNTWTKLTLKTGSTIDVVLYYVASPTVGTGHTFTPPQTYDAICVAWYTGNSATPFDQENGTANGTTGISTGSITPGQNNELVIADVGINASVNSSTFAVNGGFTIIGHIDAVVSTTYGAALAELIQTTATAANPAFTYTGADNAAAVIASFKSGAAGTSKVQNLTILGVGR